MLTNNLHQYNSWYLLGLCCCWNCCCMTANCMCGPAALGGISGCPVVPSGYRVWPKRAGGRPCSWDRSTVWGKSPVQTDRPLILQSLYTLRRHRNISIKQNEPRQTSQLNTNPHLFVRVRVLAAAVGCLGRSSAVPHQDAIVVVEA